MSTAIQLSTATAEVQKTAAELGEIDNARISGFIQKTADMRAMAARGQTLEAQRYYDTLAGELRQLRDIYSNMNTYIGSSAVAGAAAGAWLFGVGAVAGGLVGGTIGYFGAKERKRLMLDLLDHLRVELGHRP